MYMIWMSTKPCITHVEGINAYMIKYRDDCIHGDLDINRFILMVLLFVFSMIFLIIRPNMISILLGWDGLGLGFFDYQ
jgi:NADH-ubiquinone oxidoreductase chain 5